MGHLVLTLTWEIGTITALSKERKLRIRGRFVFLFLLFNVP